MLDEIVLILQSVTITKFKKKKFPNMGTTERHLFHAYKPNDVSACICLHKIISVWLSITSRKSISGTITDREH